MEGSVRQQVHSGLDAFPFAAGGAHLGQLLVQSLQVSMDQARPHERLAVVSVPEVKEGVLW
eukprot:10178091-Prorocentrum_lima.AAC.1